MIIIYKFILGSIIGSFSSLVSIRIFKNESIIAPRSHCDNCFHRLSIFELIPIISFIALNGKCFKCKHPIGIINLLSEIIMGIIFTQYDFSLYSFIKIIFEWILILISLCDIHELLIPNKLIELTLIIALIKLYFENELNLIPLLIYLLSYLIISLTNNYTEWIGNGDIDIIWIMLIYNNINNIITCLFISSLLAIGFSLVRKRGNAPIPFTPFLTFAFIIIN